MQHGSSQQLALRFVENFVGETLSQPARLLMVAMGVQGLASREQHLQLVYLIVVHGLFEFALEQVGRVAFARLVRLEYLLGQFVVKCAQVGQEVVRGRSRTG